MADIIRTGVLSALETTYISRKALPTLEKQLVIADFCTQPFNVPEEAGSTAKWWTANNLTWATATDAFKSLTNTTGDTGATYQNPVTWASRTGHDMVSSLTTVSKQVDLYGGYIPMRKTDMRYVPKAFAEALAKRVAYAAAIQLDTICRATIDGSGTGNTFAPTLGSGTTTTRRADSIPSGTANQTLTSADTLCANDVAQAWGVLRANDAQPFDNGLGVFIAHEVAITHLITDVGTTHLNFAQIHQYTSGATGNEKLQQRSPGSIGGCMVVGSTNIGTTTGIDTLNAYVNICLARDAFGTLGVGTNFKNPIKINRLESGPSTLSDPHQMFGAYAFQYMACPALLDANRALLLYSYQP